MKQFLVLLALTAGLQTSAAKEIFEKYPIKKGFQVSVVNYDAKTDSFLLEIVGESGVGPNYALTDDLVKAVDFAGGAAALRKNAKSSVGSIFQLKKDLRLITEDEVERRAKQQRK